MFGIGKKSNKSKDSNKTDIEIVKLKSIVDQIFTNNEDNIQKMNRFLKEFKGEWWDEKELKVTDSRIFANYIFSTAMTVAPLLTDNRPIWSVRARSSYFQKVLNIYSLALEYLWDKLDMDMVTFKWVLDALIMKIGILKCSFDPEIDELKAEVIDPRTFFCAPGYDDLWDAPFMGQRVVKPLSWVRLNFPETGSDVVADDERPGVSLSTSADWENHNKKCTVYEVWMRDSETEEYFENEESEDDTPVPEKKKTRKKYPNGRIVTFASTSKVPLEDKPCLYRHNKPPYIALYDYMIPHELIGMGEPDQLEQLNKSYNRALQLMDNHIAQFCNPNFLIDSQAGMDVELVKSTFQGGGNMYAHNPTTNPDPVKQVEVKPVSPTVIQGLTGYPKVIEEVTGVTDVSKGVTGKTQRQSATEISSLMESSYTRTRQRVRNLEWSLKRLCYIFVDLMQQYYTENRTFNVKRDNEAEWYDVSNSKNFAMQAMKPKADNVQEAQKLYDTEKEYLEEMEGYQALIENFGDKDEVYFPFDISIDTNSTLPMDKQSLANLFIRLAEMKIIDPQAVIEQLRIPRGSEIINRMKQAAELQMQAKGPQPARAGVQDQAPPLDMADMLKMQGVQNE